MRCICDGWIQGHGLAILKLRAELHRITAFQLRLFSEMAGKGAGEDRASAP